MREPWGHMTPGLYASLSDRQLVDCYLAPRDEDGALVPERKRRRPQGAGGPTGRPEDAARELPPPEELGVPEEALLAGIPADWVLMFWQVWRGRGLTAEETLAKFWEQTGRGPDRRR